MNKLAGQLAGFERQFKELYKPETAQGNEELLKVQNEINRIKDILEENVECSECEGWGNRDCSECGQERWCRNCNGIGLLTKA